MPLVQVAKNIQPRQIEFDEKIERSKPGALYFVPGQCKKITKDELKWIQEKEKRFSKYLTIIYTEDKPSRLEREKTPLPHPPKRPKDNISQHKQRAREILEKAKNNSAANVSRTKEPLSVNEPSNYYAVPPTTDETENSRTNKSKKREKK